MQAFTTEDIGKLDRYDRVNFVHSLVGFKTPVLIGTLHEDGKTNLAIFNSLFHVGSNPPLIGLKFRPITDDKHTYKNFKRTGTCTINMVTREIYRRAHLTSARVGKETSEFDTSELTQEFIEGIAPPFVQESCIKYALSFQEEHVVQSNHTILVIGKVERVLIPKSALQKVGSIDLSGSGIVANNGLYEYHRTIPLETLGYVHLPVSG